jgi:hypothetical protein
MQFSGRDLKPHAEPITPERLVAGEIYFTVKYHDQDLLAPEVEALAFLGNDLEAGPEGVGHYFQDAGSYLAGVRYGVDDEGQALFLHQPPGQVKHIFEFEKALDELLKCSLRRASSPHVKYRPIERGRLTRG